MLSTRNYDEVNNQFTELTSEDAADVNGGGIWGGVVGGVVGFLLAGPAGAEAGTIIGAYLGG